MNKSKQFFTPGENREEQTKKLFNLLHEISLYSYSTIGEEVEEYLSKTKTWEQSIGILKDFQEIAIRFRNTTYENLEEPINNPDCPDLLPKEHLVLMLFFQHLFCLMFEAAIESLENGKPFKNTTTLHFDLLNSTRDTLKEYFTTDLEAVTFIETASSIIIKEYAKHIEEHKEKNQKGGSNQ